jgi:hypothetical protein
MPSYYPKICIRNLSYVLATDEKSLVLKYLIHIRKPQNNITKYLGLVTFTIVLNGNTYVQTSTLTSNMTADTLVERTYNLNIDNMSLLNSKIFVKVKDSYDFESKSASIIINNNINNAKVDFYYGKIRICYTANNLSNKIIKVKQLNETEKTTEGIYPLTLLSTDMPTTANNVKVLPWILLYRESDYIVSIGDDVELLIHTAGYLTPPSTYFSFKTDVNLGLKMIKFRITDIQSDCIYFALSLFNGGYQGIQRTADKRINNTKHILISSQWNDYEIINGTKNMLYSSIEYANEKCLIEEFGGEGDGVKVMLDYDWKVNTDYILSVHGKIVEKDGKKYIYITRHIFDNSWKCISITKTPLKSTDNGTTLLGTNVGAFLEAWTNNAIFEGKYFQKAIIYGAHARDINNNIVPITNVYGERTNSILDPNNDLSDAGFENGKYYYCHGYNNETKQMANNKNTISNQVFESTFESYGNIAQKWNIHTKEQYASLNINIVPTLIPKISLFFIKNNNTMNVRWETNIPYYKFILQDKEYYSGTTYIMDIPYSNVINLTLYDIYGDVHTSKLYTDISASFCVKNFYINWINDNPFNKYRIKLYCDTKILIDTDYTIMGNNYIIQYVQKDQIRPDVTLNNKKYILVNNWDDIRLIQQQIKTKYTIGIQYLNVSNIESKEIIIPINYVTF